LFDLFGFGRECFMVARGGQVTHKKKLFTTVINQPL